MKKYVSILAVILCCQIGFSQNSEEKDKKQIQSVLKKQRLAWSKNNIEEFMEGYWKSDSLKFYGTNGVISGWENTLEYYEKGYPSEDHTGILSFKINDISRISDDAYFVLAEYHIKRNVGNATGIFMVVFKRIDGEWKIIADMSC